MHVHDREAVRTGDGTKVNELYVEAKTRIAGVIPASRIWWGAAKANCALLTANCL